MGYGGRQQPPPGSGRPGPGQPPPPYAGQAGFGGFDPLAAAGNVPSWPDQAVPGGPPRLAATGAEGMAGAWPDLPGLPEIGPTVMTPKPGPRMLIPVAAALVIASGFLVLPWADGRWYPSIVAIFHKSGARDFGDLYALYFAGSIGLLAVLVGFAGATDQKLLRWLQFGAALLMLGTVTALGLQATAALRTDLFAVAGVVLLASGIVAVVKRLPLRICAGAFLVGCALVHIGTLATWDAPWLSMSAYLPAFGYLVGACGAVIGPRYVPEVRRV